MIQGHLSYFDAAVVAIMLLSCLFAFIRGFVKELLSLGAWIGAGLITIYYFPTLAARLEPHFKSPIVASGIATLSLYIISLLCFSIINALILRFVKEGGDIGVLDNTFGLLFGAFRGALIVSLGYFMLTMAMSENNMPDWVQNARTRPYVAKGAELLARVAPDYLTHIYNQGEAKEEHDRKEPKTEQADKYAPIKNEVDKSKDRLKALFSKDNTQ